MLDILKRLYESIMQEKELLVVKAILFEFLSFSKELIGRKHPLGFYSFNLGRITDKINIRLHVWDPELLPQDKNLMIHNHIFNFKSLVLVGKVNNLIYSLNTSYENTGTLYSVAYNQKGSVLTKIETGYSALLIKNTLIEKGDYYSVESSEFHESVNFPGSFSATLLVTEQLDDAKAIVFGIKDFGRSIEFEREEMGKDQIQYDIQKLISMI